MQVLQAVERERVLAMEMGEDVEASITSVDDALGVLLRNATEEYGFAPRDVYEGILLPTKTRGDHDEAVGCLDYQKLQSYVEVSPHGRGLSEPSDCVIAVTPREIHLHHVKWTIDFKSDRIGKTVAVSMRSAEVEDLRSTYDLLRATPATSCMAGRVFESFVHRVLPASWPSTEPLPQHIRLVPDHNDPPTFSVPDPSSFKPDPRPTPLFIPPPVRTSAREPIQISLPADLGCVTLGNDKYYIPFAINNPLFDSFTVDHDPDNRMVVISIFQIATSPSHEGSAKGYPHIQKIMARVYELLGPERSDTTVKVVYFLACPEGGSGIRWKMPVGWNKQVTRDGPEGYDHRGEVFRLPFPGASCLITPNFAIQLNHNWV